MRRNNVKLLVQRHRSAAADSTGANIIQNSSLHVVEAHVRRDGLRAVDSGEFTIPTNVPVSEGDIVKWIQDDADVTHLRSCYLFQGSLRDEGGWEADGENTNGINNSPQTVRWNHVGVEQNEAPAGANKFKGLLRIDSGNEGQKYSKIPNKLMYVNKTVSGGDTTANVHDFDGDFEINIWVTAHSAVNSTRVIFAKVTNSWSSGKRVSIYQGSSGQIQADIEDGDNHEVQLTTGSKICKASSANFIRLQRKGNKFSLWLINGTESSSELFTTPDDTETNDLMESVTVTQPTILGASWNGSSITQGYTGIVHSVRIYCGGVLSIGDARSLYKARATPLVMKLAGTVWKIKDVTKGKKIYATGFGKLIPETEMDTNILDSGNEDVNLPMTNTGSGARTLNVYKNLNVQNIMYSMLTMLNAANTDDANNAATDFNNFSVAFAINEAGDIDEFIAEGNLLSLIKILLTRATQPNVTYSFFVSPRGVCLLEFVGIDRGITFNHDPYNMQVSAADDTFTANDLTVVGRIPINTFVKSVSNHTIGTASPNENTISFSSAEIGSSIPLAVRVYDSTDSVWLNNTSVAYPNFTIDREDRKIKIIKWNDNSVVTSEQHSLEIHVDYEYINTGATTPNLRQFKDETSITNIGRYKKRIYVPQLTHGADILTFGGNLLGLTKNINKRYTIKAPFLVNFVRENHKVTVKNTIKNINAANQIVKSIHWHYPANETIIEVGEHEADAYDLVVGTNETVHALTSQSLKSMNR